MKKSWLAAAAVLCLTAGCGKNNVPAAEAGYRDDVSAQALAELAPEYLDDWYGVSEEMYEEYYGQTPMISANVDALLVVRADKEHVEDVRQALDTYRESMVQDTFQYPINIPKIQASRIESFGNYVCFVQLGGSMEGIMDDDEAAIAACQKANEQALDVIEGELTK